MADEEMAIRVRNLSKKYRFSDKGASYNMFRDAIANAAKAHLNRLKPGGQRPEPSDFWALKDISFDLKMGEVIGIIGRNGSGKSTLLKILSRITEPTEGMAELYGRVGSLLEVGTGFHPELTGRENIYLSGSILGMRKNEIETKFDNIVKFAETEKFLDMQLKHYSSGMQVRLGFAVAAYLEPEILIVDEVLAVGDAAFQKKCMGKMGSVAKEGRTVIFVSHNMQAIRQLCSRSILLKAGQIVHDGPSKDIIEKYLLDISPDDNYHDMKKMIARLPADPVFRITSIEISQGGNQVFSNIHNNLPLEIMVHYDVLQKTAGLRVFFDLCDVEDSILFRSFNDENGDGISTVFPGHYKSKAIIPAGFLAPIVYEIRIFASIFNVRTCEPKDGIRIPLYVDRTVSGNRAYSVEPIMGRLTPDIKWTTIQVSGNRVQEAIMSS